MNQTETKNLIKILLVGDSGSGKSNMLLRYADNTFSQSFIATIGIDFKYAEVTINGKKYNIRVWDTAGQERFRTITAAYYRGAMGIMIVYDICDLTSFNNVNMWLQNIDRHIIDTDVKLMLIGNKNDNEDARQVSKEKAMNLVDDYNDRNRDKPKLEFMEVSAKSGTNIELAFFNLASRTVPNIIPTTNEGVVFIAAPVKKKSWCTIL
jgi:small GTP-binding protein